MSAIVLGRGWGPVSRRTALAAVATALACTATAVLLTLGAYSYQPYAAFGAPLVVALIAAIAVRPVIGVYCFLLAVPFELLALRVGGGFALSPSEVFLIITAAVLAIRFVLSVEGTGHGLDLVQLTFAGLILVTLLGFFVAEDSFPVFKTVAMWTAMLIVASGVANLSRETVKRLLVVMVVGGAIVAAIAISRSGDQQQLAAGGQIASGRAESTFSDPNGLAAFLVLVLAPGIALAGHGRGLQRVLMATAAAAGVGALVLTLSRGGFIGAGVTLLVLLAWKPARRVTAALLVFFAVFAILNLSTLQHATETSVVGRRLSTLTSSNLRQQDARVRIWSRTPRIIADHPLLGVGSGNFSTASARYGLQAQGQLQFNHAHDIFLTLAAETGVVGLGLLVAFVFAVGRAAARALRVAGRDYPLVIGLVAAQVALLAMGLVDYPFRNNALMAIILTQVGALIAYGRTAAPGRAPAAR